MPRDLDIGIFIGRKECVPLGLGTAIRHLVSQYRSCSEAGPCCCASPWERCSWLVRSPLAAALQAAPAASLLAMHSPVFPGWADLRAHQAPLPGSAATRSHVGPHSVAVTLFEPNSLLILCKPSLPIRNIFATSSRHHPLPQFERFQFVNPGGVQWKENPSPSSIWCQLPHLIPCWYQWQRNPPRPSVGHGHQGVIRTKLLCIRDGFSCHLSGLKERGVLFRGSRLGCCQL